jgi:hypothetical protein
MIKETRVKKSHMDLIKRQPFGTKIGLSQKQHWNGIHSDPGKEDALEQHGDGQC